MHRFFIENKQSKLSSKTIIPDKELLFQLTKVLRIKANENFVCVHNEKEFECIFENNEIKIISEKEHISQTETSITLVQSLPKNSKIDLIIQKSTELSIDKIIFFLSERSISRITINEFKKKITRWNKIAKEASEQARRIKIPVIEFFESKEELCINDETLKLLMYEEENITKLTDLEFKIKKSNNIAFLIGPEGGFSKKEADYFENKNWTSVNLGKEILRTETASLYVLSVIKYLKGK